MDEELKDLQVAQWIAYYLFVNGAGQRAERLVLLSSEGKNLGGWSRRAVVNCILRNLKESRDNEPKERGG